ncbi:trithorax group protein osa-like [Anopheles albimanus]|uniref:trithorax group protein osa-like n=1 Tax=Anopheles albimanus TaxID=7167 RepID=UPI0016412D7C|nr:trithorax group protein osa-like [Anopheles albimanus]
MSAKKYLKMPAQQPAQPAAKTEKEEQLWNALKRHIMRERERKKQELQAEVEEERLRREREEREKQDVMTLGETKEQILILEKNLEELRNEKQQLFLQLKKVLNEDDNRKRQMKEEMMAIQNIQPQQIFLPQRSIGPPHQQHLIHKGNPQVNVAKRTHSPSSPQHLQGYYKQPNPNNQTYPSPQKMEDGRRSGEVARAVLWNKSQYCPPVGFYPSNPPSNPPPPDGRQPQQILYPYQSNLTIPMRQYVDIPPPPQQQQQQQQHQQQQPQHPHQPGPPKQPEPPQVVQSSKAVMGQATQPNIYNISLDQAAVAAAAAAAMHGQQPSVSGPPLKTIAIEKIGSERIAVPYHIELAKQHDERKDLRPTQVPPPGPQPGPGGSHLPEGIYAPGLRQGAIQMHAIAANSQLPKSGSITQGYPPARLPPMPSNPQQPPPPSQMHYSRQRY